MSTPNLRPNTRSSKNSEKTEKNLSDYFPPRKGQQKPASNNDDTSMDLDHQELDPGPHQILRDGLQIDLPTEHSKTLPNPEFVITFGPAPSPAPNIDQPAPTGDDYSLPANPDDFTPLPPAKRHATTANSDPQPMDIDTANNAFPGPDHDNSTTHDLEPHPGTSHHSTTDQVLGHLARDHSSPTNDPASTGTATNTATATVSTPDPTLTATTTTADPLPDPNPANHDPDPLLGPGSPTPHDNASPTTDDPGPPTRDPVDTDTSSNHDPTDTDDTDPSPKDDPPQSPSTGPTATTVLKTSTSTPGPPDHATTTTHTSINLHSRLSSGHKAPATAPPSSSTSTRLPTSDPSPPSSITLDDYLQTYHSDVLCTRHLLISFIPRDITHDQFKEAMDGIQHLLQVESPSTYYHAPDYGHRFGLSAANHWSREGISYPTERQPGHCSFTLRLPEDIHFGYLGSMNHLLRPMAFEYNARLTYRRRLLVQPVPSYFRTSLLRAPTAVWRGIGTGITEGQSLAALALITTYVKQASQLHHRNHPDSSNYWHTYLSYHLVDIRTGPNARRNTQRQRNNRGRHSSSSQDSDSPPDPRPPQTTSYPELFAITVCSHSLSEGKNCYQALIPQARDLNLSSPHPINLCGWLGELTSSLDNFRSASASIGLHPHLLTPLPLTLIPLTTDIIPSLSPLLDALNTEGQSTATVLFPFLQRGPRGDLLLIATSDDTQLEVTDAFRQTWTSATSSFSLDTADSRLLREHYASHRAALGLSTTPPTRQPPSAAASDPPPTSSRNPPRVSSFASTTATQLTVATRVIHAGDPSYLEVARLPSSTDQASLVRLQASFEHLLAQSPAFAALKSDQDKLGEIVDSQQTMADERHKAHLLAHESLAKQIAAQQIAVTAAEAKVAALIAARKQRIKDAKAAHPSHQASEPPPGPTNG